MIAYMQEQSCVLPLESILNYTSDMDGLEADREFVAQLVTWSRKSVAAIARAAGLANTTLNRPFKGTATTRISAPTMDKLKAAFPDFPGWGMQPKLETNAILAPPMQGSGVRRMARDLPVYGTALGAEEIVDGEAIEQTTLNRGEVVEYRRRPVVLDGRADVYGLYVQGQSMEPRFRDGEMVYAEERKRPAVGDDAVVYLRTPDGNEGETVTSVLLKTVVRKSGSFVELRQYNPLHTFKIDMERVYRMDRVLTLGDMTD